jgi:putative SOS response-associated peptidase YedK
MIGAMCFSSMEDESLRKTAKLHPDAEVRAAAMNELLRRQRENFNETKINPFPKVRFTRALEESFLGSTDPAHAETAALFGELRRLQRQALETGLFAQRARLVKAERALAAKETRKALDEKRIAAGKVEWHLRQLAALERRDIRESDRRIYPMWYTLVLARVDGRLSWMPMRYHCRQAGKPASIDKQYDGLYNARRDSLDGYWKNLWGRRHGVLVSCAFFENVALEDFEHRALAPGEKSRNVVLEFKPDTARPMQFACLWDKWQKPGEPDLYSFAVITDEPPPEVKATGHDRCPIPLKPENVAAWLTPEGRSKEELQALLDDRERPYYEHQRLAA